MKNKYKILIGLLAISAFGAINSFFIVAQTEQALVLEFGKPIKIVKEPGLQTKKPFIQQVLYFDNRLLELDLAPTEFVTSQKKYIVIDSFVRYRIVNPLKFFRTVRDENGMRARLTPIVESSIREVIGNVMLDGLLSEKRDDITTQIQETINLRVAGDFPEQTEEESIEANNSANTGFGIEILDVRVKRVDLPKENSQAIFRRMQTERLKEAKDIRARGEEEAQKIRSSADRERSIIIAEAKKQSDITRGEGDGQATKISANAYGIDIEFFNFYRTMEAYKNAINADNTNLILTDDSKFLEYINKSK